MDSVVKSDFQFSEPQLKSMVFEPNQEFSKPEAEENVDIPLELQTEVKRDPQKNIALVRLICKIGKQECRFPFYIEAVEEAKFQWGDSYNEEIIDKLLSRNAPTLLLGYLRPHVAYITEASPFPTMHIPFVDFSQNQKM